MNLEKILSSIEEIDKNSMKKVKERLDSLIKPLDSLGKLEDVCIQLGGIFSSRFFDIEKKIILGFGSDHGVYEEGVSPCLQNVTILQFENFVTGGNGVKTLSEFSKSDVWAIDVGINSDKKIVGAFDEKIAKGTKNIRKQAAMSMKEALKSIEIGFKYSQKAKEEGYNIIGVGEMGIANTTPSTAVISVLTGMKVENITGMGCGLDSNGILKKQEVILDSIKINNPNPEDAIDVLMKLGGFEIGAMTGAILGCAYNKMPIVIDGFISYASALLAVKMNKNVKDYIIVSHQSAEPSSKQVLNFLNKEALLNLNMKLGEGSGAALAFNIIDAAYYVYKNMLTFEESKIESTH